MFVVLLPRSNGNGTKACIPEKKLKKQIDHYEKDFMDWMVFCDGLYFL
jgi:hypothetical protein